MSVVAKTDKRGKPACGAEKGVEKRIYVYYTTGLRGKPENKANLFHIRKPALQRAVNGLAEFIRVVISRSFDEPNCATGNRKKFYFAGIIRWGMFAKLCRPE